MLLESRPAARQPEFAFEHVMAFKEVVNVALEQLKKGEICLDSQNRPQAAFSNAEGWLYLITTDVYEPENQYGKDVIEVAEPQKGILIHGCRFDCKSNPAYTLHDIWLPNNPELVTTGNIPQHPGIRRANIERLSKSLKRSEPISMWDYRSRVRELYPTVRV